MRQQLGLFLASCLVAISSSATVPLVLKVSERSFQVQGGGSQPPTDPKEAQLAQTDPKILTDVITQIWVEDRPEYVVESIYSAKRNLLEKRALGLQEKYSQALAEYVDGLAKDHKATVKQDGNSKVYAIEDGISFFRDFYRFAGQKDPMFQLVAKAFLRGPYRQASASSVDRLAVDLHEDQRAKTYLLPVKSYTEADLESLKSISRGKGYRYEKVGETYVFGSGMSFLLTRDLMKEGLSQRDPALRADFAKILRYHEAFQIPVIHGYHQGALAYYNPQAKEMSFVKPNFAGSNAYTHEMTHSRFDKFTATLTSWIKSKGYVVPFHVDGPIIYGDRGGLYTLLNELNSFRMGEQFGGGPGIGSSDAEILTFIKQSYGLQAGFEATEMLDKVWTTEKVANKSVAYLIYSEIRDFNRLSNEQLIDMARSGVETNDFVKKMNFLLMFEAGRFKGTALETQAAEIFTKIGEIENERYVAEYYEKIAKENGLKISEEVQKKTGSSLDLQKATFNQVFKEFSKRGSQEAMELLQTKFASQLGPQHIEAFVERAMGPPKNHYNPEGLSMLFFSLGIQNTALPVTITGSTVKVRPVVKSPLYAKFDEVIAKNLFNGGDIDKRLGLLNFITLYTRPEEMPQTYAKLLSHLRAEKGLEQMDIILARQVFMPQDGTRGRSALWGDQILKDPAGIMVDPQMMDNILLFLKESMSPYLTQKYAYGEYASVSLNLETRGRVLRALKQLSPEQKHSLQVAGNVLWHWSASEYPMIRTSALYAMLSNPMYLLVVEAEMIKTIKAGDPTYRAVNEFLLNAAEGVLPKAKEAMEAYKATSSKFVGLSKVVIDLPATKKSIYSQQLLPVGNSARVVMSCKKVFIAQ